MSLARGWKDRLLGFLAVAAVPFASAYGVHGGSDGIPEPLETVSRSERALVIVIDGKLDRGGMLLDQADRAINISGKVLLQSVLESQYGHISWIIGDEVEDERWVVDQWRAALARGRVVDHVSFVHDGQQGLDRAAAGLAHLKPRKGQLRYVYTSACGGGRTIEQRGNYSVERDRSIDMFLRDFGAMAVIGHQGTSASPFVGFPFLYYLAKGMSFAQAGNFAWQDALEAINLGRHTLGKESFMSWVRNTEPVIRTRSSLNPSQLRIDTMTVPEAAEGQITEWRPAPSAWMLNAEVAHSKEPRGVLARQGFRWLRMENGSSSFDPGGESYDPLAEIRRRAAALVPPQTSVR